MIRVAPGITLDDSEIQEEFVRSSGPGGQNVNKVATAVQLRFNVLQSPSLPEDVRGRLLRLARNRINADGELVIEAKQFRTQDQNRQAALDRLLQWVRHAAEKPKIRKETRPTLASKQRRLETK